MNITEFGEAEFWLRLLDNEFNCGFVAALILILGIMILMLLIRLILHIMFRTRRCSSIVVPRPNGNIVVSRDAVLVAARRELDNFPEIKVDRIQLYARKKIYLMTIYCGFTPTAQGGISELSDKFKPQVVNMLKQVFGIENLSKIKVVIEALEDDDKSNSPHPGHLTETAPAAAISSNVYTGF